MMFHLTSDKLMCKFVPAFQVQLGLQSYSYSMVPGIYGCKQTESEGVACLFTTAINPWPLEVTIIYPPDWSFVVITVYTSVHVKTFTVTSTLFTHNCI